MATRFNNITCLSAFEIQGTDCIGDSRYFINLNTENLGVAICNLSATLSAQALDIATPIRSLSTAITSANTFLSSTVFTLRNNLTSLSATIDVNKIGVKTTLNTLVSSLSVFSTTGTYIGYIPIYK